MLSQSLILSAPYFNKYSFRIYFTPKLHRIKSELNPTQFAIIITPLSKRPNTLIPGALNSNEIRQPLDLDYYQHDENAAPQPTESTFYPDGIRKYP